MTYKTEILIALKKRLAMGEISKSEYNQLKAEILGVEAPTIPNVTTFDARATYPGIGQGTILRDRYEIVKEIGRGGMGGVYKAKDLELDTVVAVKVLRAELARDTRAVRSLMEEAKVSMRLTHPKIMRLINFESDERQRFLVMEYIEGETLEARLERERKIPRSELIPLAVQICEGLAHSHREKVIHRDIKPSNIMVTKKGEVKILDFGIARVAADSMTRITGQVTLGTLVYMSPEQIRGKDVDLRSDIYALGITLYELLTGNPPFSGVSLEHQHLHETPEPMGDVSPRLNEIVLKCLEKRKDRRFQSAEEMKAALTELESEAIRPEIFDRESSEKPKNRSLYMIVLWGVLGIFVVIAGYLILGPSGKKYVTPQANVSREIPSQAILEPEMVRISGGTFIMGSESSEAYNDEKPIHRVTLDGFWIGKYEVTQAEWVKVMGSNPSSFKGNDWLPVENVSWNDVQAYIQKLNAATGKHYRLPTEAEWECACRAGTTGDRYGALASIAWYDDNSGGRTHPVGEKGPNAFGLYDMLGNVWEWCADWYGSYWAGSVTNPHGPSTGASRVVRGGSWFYFARVARASFRIIYDPSGRFGYLGFRLARD